MSVPAQPRSPTFVSVSDFAYRVSASRVKVREWIALGMPACRVDRHWRIELERALEWMRGAHRVP